MSHAQNIYALYYDQTAGYQGIVKKQNVTTVLLSSISESATLQGYLAFNKDACSTYAKNYHAYWQWLVIAMMRGITKTSNMDAIMTVKI